MKTTMVASGERVWFLAAGTKKIGPLSRERVLERIAEGKVSPRVKAWREGMAEWTAVGEIAELGEGRVEGPAPRPSPRPAAPRRAPLRTSGDRPAAAAFKQPHRIERADLWRAFELGFEVPRMKVALTAFGAMVLALGASAVAAWLTPILGLLAALALVPLTLVVTALATGALSYQTRRAVETGATPSALEALGFAKDHGLALVVSPILISLLAFVPPVALILKSLLSHVPAVGGPFAGLTFGVDLALMVLALFVAVAASLAWHFVPAIVACEETGPIGTVRALLGVVRTRIPRILLWPARPWVALSALAFGLVLLAALVTVVPAALNASALGVTLRPVASKPLPAPSSDALDEMPRLDERPFAPKASPIDKALAFASNLPVAFEPGVGLAGVVGWTAVLFAIVAAIVLSTANALVSVLYLACRPGNDDLITRDDWLARRTEAAHAAN